ncbi:MAG: chemotaxis protein CheB [Planctomycetota bacterium]
MGTSKNSKGKDSGGDKEARTGPPARPPFAETGDSSAETDSPPVVGIGASAGGLEALRLMFSHVSADSGIAFVVIQHLDPEQPSMLTSVLEGITRLPVVETKNGMPVKRNRVHVIPSGSDISIEGGTLRLVPRRLTGRLHLPIDSFFRSLALERRNRAVGVILSGSGADGTEGLRAIKAEGGIAIAQEPDSTRFREMPESAIAAGVVDFRGTPQEIAGELERLCRHPYLSFSSRIEGELQEPPPSQEESLSAVFALVRQQAGIDFSGYKRTTVLRRIERRMALRQVGGLDEYVALLTDSPEEARSVAQDMLIHVTSFFRDPEAFTALEEKVFAELGRGKDDRDSIRIWIPGCATGEEAYAVAISLLESLGTRAETLAIKIFGTDLSEEAIETARVGRYPESAVVGIAPERLSRHFERMEGGYQIAKHVRDLCVFVRHDLSRDPPFAKLDLISCRNLLIYFDVELQRRVIPLMHHCLNRKGHLFLGQSETIAGYSDIFAPLDKEHRIFVKTGESRQLVYPAPADREVEGKLSEGKLTVRRHPAREAQRQADHLLLAHYAPPGVLVNERMEIVQFRGRTGAFLEPPPGQPQTNLLRMVREDLVVHVRDAIESAKARSGSVRIEGLRIQVGSENRVIDLNVTPLALTPDLTDRYFLVLFEESAMRPGQGESQTVTTVKREAPSESIAEIHRLKTELVATKNYLQSLISEHQAATEDLAATNEEMVATNEELQSTNEELQSIKEELQSTNEELSTVNDQLQTRNQELDQIASDLENVLSSVEIPVIIVDLELRVRRFTPSVSDIASFIPEDVRRPIDDLKMKLQVDDLPSRIREVIDGLSPKEWEVQRRDGHWFQMHIRPYRRSDQRLDGAVLAFLDVDILKHAREEAESTRDYARNIVDTVTAALVVLDSSLRILSANASFLRSFSISTERIEGKSLFALGAEPWQLPAIRKTLEASVTTHAPFSALEVKTELPHLGRRVLSLTGRPIISHGVASMMLLTVDDITELRALETERELLLASEKEARLEAERANQAKDLFLAILSHELRTPLSTMLMSAELLKQIPTEDLRIERASASIERAAKAQSRLIDDLLDVSRIVSGKLMLDLAPVDLEAVVQGAIDIVQPTAQAKSLDLDLVVDGEIGTVCGDSLRLQQVVNNLLSNAIKFTSHGGRVSVRIRRDRDQAQLTVTDTGMGIRPEVLSQLFNRFVQADSSVTRTHGGLGLGLSIIRHIVEAHGGQVHAESPGEGHGATFRVTLPLGAVDDSRGVSRLRVGERKIVGVRVLLVEDDDDTRESYAAMLTELGAQVRAASSAADGYRALEEFHPQVLLSDIAMPGEDGLSFMRRVRCLPPERGGRVPAVVLTALGSDDDRQRAFQAGFQMHVRKPVDAAHLQSIVATLADERLCEEWREAATAEVGRSDQLLREPAKPPRTRSLRIMVVEHDDPFNPKLSELLERRGYDTRSVPDGRAALETNRSFQPDVALLELGLPDQDSYELAQRLREKSKNRRLLLVALTDKGADRTRLEQAGFDRHLLEPADVDALDGLLEEWDSAR